MNPLDEAANEATRRQEEVLVRLRKDLKTYRLAIITGAGVTLNVTADGAGKPLSRITWTGLIRNGLDYLVHEGYVGKSNRRTKRAYEALEDLEVDGLLDAATIMSSQMKQHGQFSTWLESVFGSLSREIRHPALLDVLKALHESRAILLTTNYDDVLEKHCGIQPVGRSKQEDVLRFRRGDLTGVFHIHGSYHDADEVVLDTTDYYKVESSEVVQDMLRSFLQDKTILFVGCGSGLEDPNFDALLRWASEGQKGISNQHCLLIRDDDTAKYQPLVRVKYGPRHKDLVGFLQKLLDNETITPSLAPSVGLDSTILPNPLRVLSIGSNKDYEDLQIEILSRVSQQCNHNFSTAGLTQRWKNFWSEKICLLWLQSEGKDWPDIVRWFEKNGNGKSYNALYAEWTRVSNEVRAMQGAARRYKDLYIINQDLGILSPSPWDWISASMKGYGARDSWTPGKVEYAWHHGVSNLLSDITIVCTGQSKPQG